MSFKLWQKNKEIIIYILIILLIILACGAFGGIRLKDRFTIIPIVVGKTWFDLYLLRDENSGQEFIVSPKATLYPIGYNTNIVNILSVEGEK